MKLEYTEITIQDLIRLAQREQGEPGEEAIIGGVRRRRRSDLVEHTTPPEYLRTGTPPSLVTAEGVDVPQSELGGNRCDKRHLDFPEQGCESRANGLVGVVPEGEVGGEEHARSEGKGAGRGASGFRGGP